MAMPRKPRPLVLCEADCQQLAHIVERGGDWRARQRARTLLLLHSGKPINTVATEQGLNRTTRWAHTETPGWPKASLGCLMRRAVVRLASCKPSMYRSFAIGHARRP